MLSKLKKGDRFVIKNSFGEMTDVVTYVTPVFIKTELGKTFRKETGLEVNSASDLLKFTAKVDAKKALKLLGLEVSRIQAFKLNKIDFNTLDARQIGRLWKMVDKFLPKRKST